jgi:hypothetical protein
MTDTIHHNGTHDAQESDKSGADAGDITDENEAAAQLYERRRVKHEALKREINKKIDALLDDRALVVAEIARDNRQIALARAEVKARGRKKNAPAKGTKR